MVKADGMIRVMLVDDHSIMREGLQALLEQSRECQVVGQAKNGDEAVQLAAKLKPHVVVMDVMMPGKDGVEACREIMEAAPETRVVILTALTQEDAVIEAVAAGATGYLQKVTDMERLLQTVKAAAEGQMQLPADVVKRAFAAIKDGARPDEGSAELTDREREILTSFSRGMSYSAIADSRGIKTVTVRNAIYVIQSKLRLESKQEIVVWAVRNGLLDD